MDARTRVEWKLKKQTWRYQENIRNKLVGRSTSYENERARQFTMLSDGLRAPCNFTNQTIREQRKKHRAFSQRLDGQHKEESMTLELLFALLVCPSLPLLFWSFCVNLLIWVLPLVWVISPLEFAYSSRALEFWDFECFWRKPHFAGWSLRSRLIPWFLGVDVQRISSQYL